MTKRHLQYLRNEAIEDITAQRIREYEAKAGVTVKLPVPVEEIVEQVRNLDFDDVGHGQDPEAEHDHPAQLG